MNEAKEWIDFTQPVYSLFEEVIGDALLKLPAKVQVFVQRLRDKKSKNHKSELRRKPHGAQILCIGTYRLTLPSGSAEIDISPDPLMLHTIRRICST